MTSHTPAEADPRDRILDAAEEHFAMHGFAGARVAAIAEHASVNKAMLYYYWGDKESLYQAVLQRTFGDIVRAVEASFLDPGILLEERLRAFVDGYRGVMAEHPLIVRVMMREMLDGGHRIPSLIPAEFPMTAARMTAFISEGQAQGLINPGVDPRLAILHFAAPFILFNVARPIVAEVMHLDLAQFRETYERSVLAILFEGLLARPSKESSP